MVDFKKAPKKREHFEKFLAFDCETSGMSFGGDPSKDYQMVSFGAIISDFTFKPIEELYCEIKWNKTARWEMSAENIHGLSRKYLDENGITEEQAVEKLGGMLYEHFGADTPITLLGHNVGTFDLPFLRKMFLNHGLTFKFSHRAMDTFSIGVATLGTYTSDELFEAMGFVKRDKHNALEDIRYTLKAFGIINKMWNKYVS